MEIKVTISLDDRTAALVGQLASAILATKVTVESNVPVVETPKAPAKKTKKVTKAEEPKEPTWEPGGGQVEDEPNEAQEENYTVDDVRTTMAEAKRSGKESADLRAILKANGAAVVSDLDPKKYAAVIKAVKAL